MKIGFVIGSLLMGGAERVVIRLSKKLLEKGHKVFIYTTLNYIGKEYSLPDGAVRYSCYDHNKLRMISKMKKQILVDNPDACIIMGRPMCIIAVPALLGTGIPVIVSERSAPQNAHIKTTTKLMSNMLMKKADSFVFQTNGARNYFGKAVEGRSFIVPNPIVIDELPDYYQGTRRKAIVAVGRLIPEKNYRLLIKAFCEFSRSNSEYTLEIYGEGKARAEIEEYIKVSTLSNKIFLMGQCDNVLNRINDAAMFVLSSELEGMPNALLEAMAIGLPVISTDCPCGGPRDLIQNEKNGLLVKINDVHYMADAMAFYVHNPEIAKSYGIKARAISNKLNIDVITEKWIKVIEQTVKEKHIKRF